MNRTLELPESVYDALLKASEERGLAPADWIASKLESRSATRPNAAREDAKARLLRHAGSIDVGRPTGLDNESIDADLGRAYAETHEADR